MAYSKVAYVTATGAGTTVIPVDFNRNDNLVTCIGSGGGGSARQSSTIGGTGGGGGAASGVLNCKLPSGGMVDVQVGAAGGTTLTWIKDAVGGTIQVQADFGTTGTTSAAGLGGLVANCIGDSGLKFKGGDGFKPGTGVGTGGGGGGAAGINGVGGNSSGVTGGSSDNGAQAGGAANSGGVTGTEFDGTHGSGSGAGGGSPGSGNHNGSTGGQYGGAGSGSNSGSTATAGGGFQGLIALQYNPDVPLGQAVM
jgi:hypothetical protein